jgi:lysophospholipase L1-like esterase
MSSANRSLKRRWIDILVAAGAIVVVSVILSAVALSRSDESSGAAYIEQTYDAAPTYVPLTVSRQPNGVARILMTGDSLSGGFYASTPDKAFTEIVATTLGNVEETDVSLLQGELIVVGRVNTVPENLNLAVIELGTNDVGRTDIALFATQYQTLIDRITTTSPDVALVCAGVWRTDGNSYDRVIESICEAAGGRFLQMGGLFRQSGARGPAGVEGYRGLSDEFHPNDLGHALIAESILRIIGLD